MSENNDITIDRIYQMLPKAVLIPIEGGKKWPDFREWQNIAWEETQECEYQELLREKSNTGVLLGIPSDDLCSIDIDSDDALEPFLELNASLCAFVTRGARGAQVWAYMEGEYPHAVKPIKTEKGEKWGEFRADGGQSVLRGIHPSGVQYQWIGSDPPPRLRFDEIVWPKDLKLPWREEAGAAEGEEARAETSPVLGRPGCSRRIVLKKRIPIELPGNGKIHSDFARALGVHLGKYDFFVKGQRCVQPIYDNSGKTYSLSVVDAPRFETALEAICVPFRISKDGTSTIPQSLSARQAATTLASPDFLESLKEISGLNSVCLPVVRAGGNIELLRQGYDDESGVLTLLEAGADWTLEKEFTAPKSKEYLVSLLSEFCFREDDRERSISIVLAGALALFCRHLFKPEVMRPGFLFTANAEGAGKSLLAKICMVGALGLAGTQTAPSENDEMRKLILSKVLGGGSTLFLDNLRGDLSSPALEALITSPLVEGRILGESKEIKMLHGLTVFLTGNGLNISADLRRRVLHVDLFLHEAKAEDRKIKRNLDDSSLLCERARIMQALWALVKDWNEAGRPEAMSQHGSFVPWSKTIGGILENAGFVTPFSPAAYEETGDQATRQFEQLVSRMNLGTKYDFGRLIQLCRENDLFSWDIPVGGEVPAVAKQNFGKVLKRFNKRLFASGRKFLIDAPTKATKKYMVVNQKA